LRTNLLPLLAAAGMALALTGCRQDMHDQPKYKPFAKSSFWPDQRSVRPMVDGTVARGKLKTDTRLWKGRVADGSFITELPVPVTKALLLRGQDRYNIYCTPCHGRTGEGEGMIVQRGFKQPPTYHSDRLRQQPPGYIYDVITNGFGSMVSYASRIPMEDRWAITAYVRVLQFSQNATAADVPEADRGRLDAQPASLTPAPAGAAH
jgi:mono/diheme cytochrome c family protein